MAPKQRNAPRADKRELGKTTPAARSPAGPGPVQSAASPRRMTSAPPTYFAQIRGEIRGPFTAAQLRDFAEAGVLVPGTPVAGARDGPWQRADALAERDVVFPPRVQLGFKPTAFTVVNKPDVAPAITTAEFIAAVQVSGPVLRPHRERETAAAAPPGPAEPPNEVQAMVNEVAAIEARLAPAPAAPPRARRFSTRARVVMALAVAGNAILAAIPTAYDAWGDEWAMLVFKAWFITYNGALGIVYFSMPRD